MLFPTSIVAINCPGVLRNLLIILALSGLLFLSSSNLSLSDETNAISIPEKKAEASNVIVMIISSLMVFYSTLFVFDINMPLGFFEGPLFHLCVRFKSPGSAEVKITFFDIDKFVGVDPIFLCEINQFLSC